MCAQRSDSFTSERSFSEHSRRQSSGASRDLQQFPTRTLRLGPTGRANEGNVSRSSLYVTAGSVGLGPTNVHKDASTSSAASGSSALRKAEDELRPMLYTSQMSRSILGGHPPSAHSCLEESYGSHSSRTGRCGYGKECFAEHWVVSPPPGSTCHRCVSPFPAAEVQSVAASSSWARCQSSHRLHSVPTCGSHHSGQGTSSLATKSSSSRQLTFDTTRGRNQHHHHRRAQSVGNEAYGGRNATLRPASLAKVDASGTAVSAYKRASKALAEAAESLRQRASRVPAARPVVRPSKEKVVCKLRAPITVSTMQMVNLSPRDRTAWLHSITQFFSHPCERDGVRSIPEQQNAFQSEAIPLLCARNCLKKGEVRVGKGMHRIYVSESAIKIERFTRFNESDFEDGSTFVEQRHYKNVCCAIIVPEGDAAPPDSLAKGAGSSVLGVIAKSLIRFTANEKLEIKESYRLTLSDRKEPRARQPVQPDVTSKREMCGLLLPVLFNEDVRTGPRCVEVRRDFRVGGSRSDSIKSFFEKHLDQCFAFRESRRYDSGNRESLMPFPPWTTGKVFGRGAIDPSPLRSISWSDKISSCETFSAVSRSQGSAVSPSSRSNPDNPPSMGAHHSSRMDDDRLAGLKRRKSKSLPASPVIFERSGLASGLSAKREIAGTSASSSQERLTPASMFSGSFGYQEPRNTAKRQLFRESTSGSFASALSENTPRRSTSIAKKHRRRKSASGRRSSSNVSSVNPSGSSSSGSASQSQSGGSPLMVTQQSGRSKSEVAAEFPNDDPGQVPQPCDEFYGTDRDEPPPAAVAPKSVSEAEREARNAYLESLTTVTASSIEDTDRIQPSTTQQDQGHKPNGASRNGSSVKDDRSPLKKPRDWMPSATSTPLKTTTTTAQKEYYCYAPIGTPSMKPLTVTCSDGRLIAERRCDSEVRRYEDYRVSDAARRSSSAPASLNSRSTNEPIVMRTAIEAEENQDVKTAVEDSVHQEAEAISAAEIEQNKDVKTAEEASVRQKAAADGAATGRSASEKTERSDPGSLTSPGEELPRAKKCVSESRIRRERDQTSGKSETYTADWPLLIDATVNGVSWHAGVTVHVKDKSGIMKHIVVKRVSFGGITMYDAEAREKTEKDEHMAAP